MKPNKSIYPISVTPEQDALLRAYADMLVEVNKRFNLISRGDVRQAMSHHIAHSLVLATKDVPAGSKVVDWGSGGGLPAIPLAIMWPDVQVIAVDSNGKKTRSIELFCRKLGIKNCTTWQGRAEQSSGHVQYSVSRATAPLSDLWSWHKRVYQAGNSPAVDSWAEGLICLKGGNLDAEIASLKALDVEVQVDVQPLRELAHDPYFSTKRLVHVTSTIV